MQWCFIPDLLYIFRYPLLLDRLYKTTPDIHQDKVSLRDAKDKIEDILGYINAVSINL